MSLSLLLWFLFLSLLIPGLTHWLEGRAWVGVRLSYQFEEKGEGKRGTDDQKDRLKEVENETHPDREGKMPIEMGGSPRKVLRK